MIVATVMTDAEGTVLQHVAAGIVPDFRTVTP